MSQVTDNPVYFDKFMLYALLPSFTTKLKANRFN